MTSYRNLPGYPSITERPLNYRSHIGHGTDGLVADADQVVGEGLDGLCRVAGLGVLTVVADEDGLFGLGDAEAFLALRFVQKEALANRFPWRVAGGRSGGQKKHTWRAYMLPSSILATT